MIWIRLPNRSQKSCLGQQCDHSPSHNIPAMPTQPSQSVVALPLAPSVRRALLFAGLSSVMDLQGLTETELMQGSEYDCLLSLSQLQAQGAVGSDTYTVDVPCCAVTGLPQVQASEVLQLTLGQPAPGWRLAGVGQGHSTATPQLCLLPP